MVFPAPINEAVRVIPHQPAIMDAGFGLIQLALGVGILHPRTVRWALAASVAVGAVGLVPGRGPRRPSRKWCQLSYWSAWSCSLVRNSGPGGVTTTRRGSCVSAARPVVGGGVDPAVARRGRAAATARDTNASISMSLAMNVTGAPAWLTAIDNRLSAMVPYQGVSIVVDLVLLQAFVGFGVLMARRVRLAAVSLGIGLSLVYWVVGQNLGQVWSGIATDPSTGP